MATPLHNKQKKKKKPKSIKGHRASPRGCDNTNISFFVREVQHIIDIYDIFNRKDEYVNGWKL